MLIIVTQTRFRKLISSEKCFCGPVVWLLLASAAKSELLSPLSVLQDYPDKPLVNHDKSVSVAAGRGSTGRHDRLEDKTRTNSTQKLASCFPGNSFIQEETAVKSGLDFKVCARFKSNLCISVISQNILHKQISRKRSHTHTHIHSVQTACGRVWPVIGGQDVDQHCNLNLQDKSTPNPQSLCPGSSPVWCVSLSLLSE